MATYVILAGLPGTGKSTLGKRVAEALGGVILNKDAVRFALFPPPFTDYSREQDDLCFGTVLRAAQYLVNRKVTEFVLLDGRTFSREEDVSQAIAAAGAAGCSYKILLTTCPDQVAELRIERDALAHPAANRSAAMYREVKARFQRIVYPHLRIDTSLPIEECVVAALGYIQC